MHWLTMLNGSSQSKKIFLEKLKNNLPVLGCFFFSLGKVKDVSSNEHFIFWLVAEKVK